MRGGFRLALLGWGTHNVPEVRSVCPCVWRVHVRVCGVCVCVRWVCPLLPENFLLCWCLQAVSVTLCE